MLGRVGQRQCRRGDAHSGAPGVDTSSGVETRPGIQDAAKIAAFVAAVAAASATMGELQYKSRPL